MDILAVRPHGQFYRGKGVEPRAMADSRSWSWGSGWQDWTRLTDWSSWEHWTGWQDGTGWQDRSRPDGSAPGASAGDAGGTVVAVSVADAATQLRQDQERKKLGLSGAWVDWDVHEFRRLVSALPEAGSDAKESIGLDQPLRQPKRRTQLGKAFQNYRRHTLHKLKKTQELARLFKIWSAVSAGRTLSLQDVLWSDSNMHAFITQHVNYESIMRWRRAQPGGVLARALPPSLVDLWRFALVSQHTSWQNKYMPDVDPNHFVHQPPQIWVERKGGTFEPTEMEQTLWSAASAGAPQVMQLATEVEERLKEAVSTTNPALSDGTLVEKLEALSGSGS